MKFSYEEGMERLETLIQKMESGTLPLEDSFQAYQEAMELYKALNQMLISGEARILEIMNAGDKDITDEVT